MVGVEAAVEENVIDRVAVERDPCSLITLFPGN
jgi:hypothetical protein